MVGTWFSIMSIVHIRTSCTLFFFKKEKNRITWLEFHDYIRNHHAKCIQISTNMPLFDEVFREICCEIWLFKKKNTKTVLHVQTNDSAGWNVVVKVKVHILAAPNFFQTKEEIEYLYFDASMNGNNLVIL